MEQLYKNFDADDRKNLYDKLKILKLDEHVPTNFLKYCSIKVSQTADLL